MIDELEAENDRLKQKQEQVQSELDKERVKIG